MKRVLRTRIFYYDVPETLLRKLQPIFTVNFHGSGLQLSRSEVVMALKLMDIATNLQHESVRTVQMLI